MMKTPKIESVPQKDPEYLRNPFLDAARNDRANANALRIGRSQLRVEGSENGVGAGFSGRVTSGQSQSAITGNSLGIRSQSEGQAARNITTVTSPTSSPLDSARRKTRAVARLTGGAVL